MSKKLLNPQRRWTSLPVTIEWLRDLYEARDFQITPEQLVLLINQLEVVNDSLKES